MTFQLVLDFVFAFTLYDDNDDDDDDDDDEVTDIGGAVLFITEFKHSSIFLSEKNQTRRH